jgi:hypothetical protein
MGWSEEGRRAEVRVEGELPPFSGSFRSVFAPDEVSSQYSKNLPDLATDTYLRDNQATDKDKAD